MQESVKLPFLFDADRMLKELQSISKSFKLIKNQYTGFTLEGIHLIIPNHDGTKNKKGESFQFTKELESCPYLQEVLETFKSDKFVFRCQNLLPGGKIGKHKDLGLGLKDGIVRLNIPVLTNDEVYTYYDDKRILMKSGECWFPNVVEDHEMENKSNETRWMLLMDCDLNDWWKEVLSENGFDFSNESKFHYQSIEELKSMKMSFLSMGFDEEHEFVKGIDLEIQTRN